MARELARRLSGRRILRVEVRRRDVLRVVGGGAFTRRLRGVVIAGAWRRAKYAILDLSSGDRLVVQPRFTGGFVLDSRTALDDPYVAVKFELDDGGAFAYRDVRRLGTVALLNTDQFYRFEAGLGVEPLQPAFSAERVASLAVRSRLPLKKFIMDQRRIAGVGNIYANEALWAARLDPSRPALSLTNEEAARLRDAVVTVLRDALRARGTSFRDYRDPYGRRGRYVERLAVYGRAGQPCNRCGTRLVGTHAIDGRASVFCYRCQQ
jgi:formamidopyrimidine-DNA glycosylase